MRTEEFDVIAKLIGSKGAAAAAARRVLVDGITPSAASREFSLSPQSVSNALARFRRVEAVILSAYKSGSHPTMHDQSLQVS